jgi:primosomal protein N' (replication factor Y)
VNVVSVALPLPFQQPFSYRVPEGWTVPARGARVAVPFGGRRAVGVVTGPAEVPPGTVLKDLEQVIDADGAVVEPALLDLAAWISEYYLAPPGECFRLVLPPTGMPSSRSVARLLRPDVPRGDTALDALRQGPLRVSALARRLGSDPTARLARLKREGLVAVEQELSGARFQSRQVALLKDPSAKPRGRAQQDVVQRLAQAGAPVPVAELVRDKPSLRGAVQRLAELGVLELTDERTVRSPDVLDGEVARATALTPDQKAALAKLVPELEGRAFAPYLLHGVTGSGKTEVYFKAVETALSAGRGALVLVPEIALTPFLVRAAVARFGSTVSVLHSELSSGERFDQWWRIRDGGSRVVVGARSAVFAPVADLGLIVVDEEHESSYKQEESPRYHARDVAVKRASLEGCMVILGSATPSLESHANAMKGKYRRLTLPARIGDHGLPRVEIVDRREVLRHRQDVMLSPPLLEGLKDRLRKGEQCLLLLNRRGYATSLLCRECGAQAVCPNCSVSLTMHHGGRRAVCHYCGHDQAAPVACSTCKGEYLKLSGFGTERILERLKAAVPGVRAERVDRDLAARRGEVERVLRAFEKGELDVLVGTQMIAKGHDFPRVTLVGVIDADVGLGLPDFRASERTFQLLTQVAGRAGRAALAGDVILQSHWPGHYALKLACEQDYEAFFEVESQYRRTMGYPPTTAMLNLLLRGKEQADAEREAEALAADLRQRASKRFRVLGPAPAPLARLRQEHRVQLLLKGDRVTMRSAVKAALVERYGPSRWPGVVVDVDPVSVM